MEKRVLPETFDFFFQLFLGAFQETSKRMILRNHNFAEYKHFYFSIISELKKIVVDRVRHPPRLLMFANKYLFYFIDAFLKARVVLSTPYFLT